MYNPNGEDDESKSYISLFLKLEKTNSLKFNVKYKLGLLKADGKKYFNGVDLQLPSEEFESFPGYGHDRLIRHNTLFDQHKNFLSNDCLTLLCEVRTKVTNLLS